MRQGLLRPVIGILAVAWAVTLTPVPVAPFSTESSRLSAQGAPLDAGMLPQDRFADGWVRTGTPKAFTKSDLYGRINGGAEAFLEIGFDQLLVQGYREAPAGPELVVEIYQMTDATAARGIYLSKRGTEKRDPALRERHTLNRYQLMFQRDRYFVIVSNGSGKETLVPALVRFGTAIASKIPADGPVAALGLLPPPRLMPGSERLLRGAYGLQAIFTLGDGDVLQLGGRMTAVAGDYADAAAGAYTLVVAEYPAPAAAAAAFRNVKANLDSYLKPVSSAEAKLVFQDFEKKFGVVSVSGRRLEVRVHLAKPPA